MMKLTMKTRPLTLTLLAMLLSGFHLMGQVKISGKATDAANEPAARRLFGVSLVYLTALFAALIAEKLIGLPALTLSMAL